MPFSRPFGQQQDHSRSHIEPAEQGAFVKVAWRAADIEGFHDAAFPRSDFTCPGRADAADIQRADHYQGSRSERSPEVQVQAFISAK